jgi:hypothetical protein
VVIEGKNSRRALGKQNKNLKEANGNKADNEGGIAYKTLKAKL